MGTLILGDICELELQRYDLGEALRRIAEGAAMIRYHSQST